MPNTASAKNDFVKTKLHVFVTVHNDLIYEHLSVVLLKHWMLTPLHGAKVVMQTQPWQLSTMHTWLHRKSLIVRVQRI